MSLYAVFDIAHVVLPAILPWSSWHASSGLPGLMIIFAIVGCAFVISLGGRPIFQKSILPE